MTITAEFRQASRVLSPSGAVKDERQRGSIEQKRENNPFGPTYEVH